MAWSFFRKKVNPEIEKTEVKKYSRVDYNVYFDNSSIDNTPLKFLNLGVLNLATGSIVSCDPLVCLGSTLPLIKTVLPGKYPVIACIAQTEHSGDRYAIVKLQFSPEKATKWEMALVEGQDVNELKDDDEYFGFPVDAGLGCFCDQTTQDFYDQWYNDFYKHNAEGDLYEEIIAPAFKKNALDQSNPNDTGDWLNFHLPNSPDLNIIMFHSGYGDGHYPCYWGISDNGKICSLIVDFMVF